MKCVLLCTPIDDGLHSHTGGIAVWAKNLKIYYNSIGKGSNVDVTFFPCNRKGENSGKSAFQRVVAGIAEYVRIIGAIKRELSSNEYDVVHLCSSASLGLFKDWVIARIVRKKNIKFIIHFRFGRILELSKRDNWEWRMLCRVVELSNKAIVIDQSSIKTLMDSGHDNVCYIPNPLSEATLRAIDSNPNVVREDRTIVFAGHVIPTKGVEELVSACKEIPNIQVKIAGSVCEDYKEELYKLAGETGAKWLHFLGQQSYEKVLRLMQTAGVFVLPTYTEGFPNVILESMACGCPIVTTPVGAIPEMLDIEHGNEYGICVQPRQVVPLKEAIELMLTNRGYAIACGENAQIRVKELYSIEQVWHRMVDLWCEQ